MRQISILVLLAVTALSFGQGKSIRIGYIDMNYILEKVPEYAEAKMQLDNKASNWKKDIDVKKAEIKQLKDNLEVEKVLLTPQLIEERVEEITFLESELFKYQENRFGVSGDLMLQKTMLVQPIQDQIFNAIQDIAEAKNYDFIIDKSSDLTILFANQRYDISDQIVKMLLRSQNREKLTKKEVKELEVKDAKEESDREKAEDPTQIERQKLIDDKREAREKILEDRKKEFEDRKKAAEERKRKILEEREAKKNGTVIEKDTNEKEPKTN